MGINDLIFSLVQDILQNEDFYQELLDVVWRVDPRNYRSNALKLYSLFRGTRDVVTGVLPDDKTTDLVLVGRFLFVLVGWCFVCF